MAAIFRVIAVIVLCVIVYSAFRQTATNSQSASPSPPEAVATPVPKKIARVDQSPAAQKKRKELIQKLINQRVFIKLETPGTLPRVSVGPVFYTLDFDTKKSFVSVVYAYHFDGSDEFAIVRIFDGRTNKEIGHFSLISGLELF